MKILKPYFILFVVLGLELGFAKSSQPNILFILVDDLGKQDLGVEGSTFYETPRIDALARSGMRFNNGYSTCQVCSPSRASLVTGKYPARINITDWIGAKTGMDWKRNDKVLPTEYIHHIPTEETTIAEAFQASGYKTFFAGKWHLGGEGSYPEDHGFEINIGGHHRGSPPGGFFAPYNNPKMENPKDGTNLTLLLADKTADFIEGHTKKGEQPFFAYLSFYAVHAPVQTTKALWEKYQKKAMKNPHQGERFKVDRTKSVRQVQDNPVYAGMMETLDNAVGTVLDALKAAGVEENTIVVFTSDNGGATTGDAYATSALPFRGGKGRQWEGGIRQPYYIKAPGVTKPGSFSDSLATGTDFFPTLLDLAGLDLLPRQHVDGISLKKVLQGEELGDRYLFWHYPHYGNQGGEPSTILRFKNWKLIQYLEDQRLELYDLSKDIGEKNNIVRQYPEMALEMLKNMNEYRMDTNALMPTPDPRYDAEKKKAEWEHRHTVIKEKLEKQHARFLESNFTPNKNWWGSESIGK
jgi:arylsulfatase A-like enzyme